MLSLKAIKNGRSWGRLVLLGLEVLERTGLDVRWLYEASSGLPFYDVCRVR